MAPIDPVDSSNVPTRPSSPAAAPALRHATTDDATLLAALHTASRAVTYRGILPDDYLDHVLPAACLAQWHAKLAEQADGSGQTLIAEVGGEAVAFVCMSEPDAQRSVYIDSLHARPDRKGGGLGTMLLEAASRWARERGANRLHLKVLEDNVGAIGFYEARGWTPIGREDDGDMDGHRVVSLIYALALAPAR